jgi:hypothetical protein
VLPLEHNVTVLIPQVVASENVGYFDYLNLEEAKAVLGELRGKGPIAVVSAVLALVALLAGLFPAYRAASIQPMNALRTE